MEMKLANIAPDGLTSEGYWYITLIVEEPEICETFETKEECEAEGYEKIYDGVYAKEVFDQCIYDGEVYSRGFEYVTVCDECK